MHLDKSFNKINEFILGSKLYKDIYTPSFYRLSNHEDSEKLAALLQEKPHIQVFDTLINQLTDLVKGLNPKVIFNKDTIDAAIKDHVGTIEPFKYGVWVYYPWMEKVVHILDQQEFIQVRTNRNKHKITQEEQDRLMQKKIGVIGLSVGQSVSLTLAIERGCGELRIADFDVLDLTNLNRIRSGVHNIDLKKTVIVAREIAEIDPFLKVTCFHEGITEDNIDAFLTENGKLDLLIDECDGIAIKILCRTKAKGYQIPVLMEASDRGTIDIERFDLEPERPILHGFIEHLDISKVKDLKTNEEKIPYILPIAGVETLSTRMKASMLEIEQTITSWPQLASAVTYGGGITADLSRRILLDMLHISGRFFVDIEEIISNPEPQHAVSEELSVEKGITFDEIRESVKQVSFEKIANPLILSDDQLNQIISIAQKGSSAGNNQPWKWLYNDGALYLFHDTERSFSFANQQNIAAYLSFGLVIESIRLKAETFNVLVHEHTFPDPTLPTLITILQFSKLPDTQVKDPLADFTALRHTSRNRPKEIIPMNALHLAEIKEAAEQVDGAKFYSIENPADLNKIANILGEADKLRLFTPSGHHELFNLELRWTKEHSRETGSGLDLESFELTPGESVGMRIAKDPKVLHLLKDWKGGGGLERLSRKSGIASAALGLITMPYFNADNFIAGGKAIERMWLAANKNQVSIHPMTASILHFNVLKYSDALNDDLFLKDKFTELNNIFYDCFSSSDPNDVPIFLFRLFYAEKQSPPSERLPIEQIFMSNSSK
ncbi:Rv1355c family protein [Pedobacter metabolipauper]|uniref:ThiF family protein n=1 Tax=Pedobacter metabolipauper TaxID=425513 RepID=A0A4V3D0N0_9SPHI|nr:Rv1355c family protein [Pedobacter metabolipauper]TDQ06470.1 ThiF family protein [Pedobacter metabolipauper]